MSQNKKQVAADFVARRCPELGALLVPSEAEKVHEIFADMGGKLLRFGSLSEKQLAFARRLFTESQERLANGGKTNRELQRERERAVAEDCPDGRVEIEGEIVKAEWRTGQWGTQLKITIKDRRGWLVWGTCPSNLSACDDRGGVERGAKIRLTATVTPSDRDPKFGFFKRPTAGEIIDEIRFEADSVARENERVAAIHELVADCPRVASSSLVGVPDGSAWR